MDTDTTPAPSPAPAPRRRWPRRLAIGVTVSAVVLGSAYWYLGRETTLQDIAQRVANASGGKLRLSGVSGSLYGAMHVKQLVWRTDDQAITAADIDIVWSPWQLVSRGLRIDTLHARAVRVQTLRDTPPSPMPASLAPPFAVTLNDARVNRLDLTDKTGATTTIEAIRARLAGDARRWELRDGAASTPWGQLTAAGEIGAARPFRLNASASFTESRPASGRAAAALDLRASGDLDTTTLRASGHAGRAAGTAQLVLSPYAALPLRSLALDAQHVDPGFFDATLPAADIALTVRASLAPDRKVNARIALVNHAAPGTLDQHRLPLQSLRAQLDGTLDALAVRALTLDLGKAGSFSGGGSLHPDASKPGLGSASLTVRTARLDLSQIHRSLHATAIAGELALDSAGATQTFHARLADKGLRLQAQASLANKVLTVQEARLLAGSGSIALSGELHLDGRQAFTANAQVARFNPAALGQLPEADLNARAALHGALAPQWTLDASATVTPSRLLGQPLSGKLRLDANARHLSDVAAALSLGQNQLALNGSFGAPGERLQWKLDLRQLDALRRDLYGSVTASGALTGSFAAPRTSFTLDARQLGWVAAQRKADNGSLQASGEAWLTGGATRGVEAKASGSAQRFNPAALGSPLPGSVNASFDGSVRVGDGWRGALDLAVRDSTLSKSPFWGRARLAADNRHLASTDIDLHVGANVVTARGAFGSPADKLEWRIDAPQLAALGPDYGGALRGAGVVTGTVDAPAVDGRLEGQNLKLLGKYSVRALRASATLGAGRGADDPLVADIQIDGAASGDTRLDALRLQARGTRASHSLRLAGRSDGYDAAVQLAGTWTGSAWNGTVSELQNRGTYAFTLQSPVPLRVATAPGAGFAGLSHPEQIALNGAVLRLPSGSVNIDSLVKLGPRWNSRGSATGVPLSYLIQAAPSLHGEVTGDLTLGAQWGLDLRTAGSGDAAPALEGMLRVARERGDLTVGADLPVVLGLRQFEARADVAAGALRVQVDLDGSRTGRARIDTTAQLMQGRLADDSPLRLTATGDMPSIAWLGPLAGQPGIDLDGALKFAITGAGSIGAPTLNGKVDGDALAVTWAEQGVRLHNGQLRAILAGDQLQLQRLAFEGRQGKASADGAIRFAGAGSALRLHLVADQLEALSRPDRTVVVSGEATLVRDARQFTLDGKLRADRALIELAPQGRPTMSDDVIVLGRGAPAKAAKEEAGVPLMVDLAADLGDDFRLRGMGIDANLAGSVRLRRSGDKAPRVNGSIKVASGTYAAYGQKLSIERGLLTFSGAYDNPALNILAVRKRPDGEQLSETNVEAGVEVRGTALAPTAKLVSTPNVSDSEKLSWLVLGHGMEGTTGNESQLLGAAAGALLGGRGGGLQSRLANSLGVDEVGLSQAKGIESTVVTVGKRISSRAYLSFEQGASTATSVVRLRYKLNPRITLQFQTGTNNALDVLYSWTFD